MINNGIHIQAQQAWLKYIEEIEDSSILLSDLQHLGYNYEQIDSIFREAIDTFEKVDMEALTLKML